MTNGDTESRRGEAWELGLQGDYNAALKLIDDVLAESPSDLVALRMKGNLLELKTLDLMESSGKKLVSSREYLAARDCYEQVLRLDPRNVTALIDLGDHYRNLDAYDKALSYYEHAADVLREDESRSSWNEEVQELLERSTELAKRRKAPAATKLQAVCRGMLKRNRPK